MTTRDGTTTATDLVAKVGSLILDNQATLTTNVLAGYIAEISELQGDPVLVELLRVSVETNLETAAHLLGYEVDVDTVTAPLGAEEYARRLAQRGISLNALVRAYRLGHQWVIDWALEVIRDQAPDADIAFAACRILLDRTFRYIDRVSEQVVHEYETERQKWLDHRSTVRTQVLEQMLAGERIDVVAAERALGHRLHQPHLAAVIWSTTDNATTDVLHRLERLAAQLGHALNAPDPLIQPRDRSTAWVWFGLGRSEPAPQIPAALPTGHDDDVQVAFGAPHPGPDGFRISHLEALRATTVACAARGTGRRITPYSDAGVRAATLLATDLEGAHRMVGQTLGGLAEDSPAASRLRDTLLVFLSSGGSHLATAQRLHLHKNTVKYRVEKAIAARGRPLDEDRLDVELALLACRWLGTAVLSPPT